MYVCFSYVQTCGRVSSRHLCINGGGRGRERGRDREREKKEKKRFAFLSLVSPFFLSRDQLILSRTFLYRTRDTRDIKMLKKCESRVISGHFFLCLP